MVHRCVGEPEGGAGPLRPYRAIPDDDPAARGPIGVLLANQGSPEAPTARALRPYLRRFLSDPRIIEPPPPRWIWLSILHGIILRTRPRRSAKLYEQVWTEEGAPLTAIGRKQCAGLDLPRIYYCPRNRLIELF